MTLSKNTINRYAKLGMVGTFPLARGYEDMMLLLAFKLLVIVVESCIQINQVNSIVIEWPQLIMAVKRCCSVVMVECRTNHSVYYRVMRLTTVSLNADVSPAVEDRRVQWLSYPNLIMWSKNFQVFLVEFGIAEADSNGDLTFAEEQKHLILNVDKTEISLDTSKTRAGGRPDVLFHNPHLPLTSRSVSKSLIACTGILGSSAAGKCKPVHFQLLPSAMAEEREKIWYEFLTHILDTPGKFGFTKERSWPCTIRMNKKGGMTDVDFEKYIDNSIVHLYPDLKVMTDKLVLLKVDSGPVQREGVADEVPILWALYLSRRSTKVPPSYSDPMRLVL